MPKISVIVPVYNVGLYLEECLQSLANQTMSDAEFLLIDDGSTDESGTICDRWAAQDSRFRVAHKENGGVSSARNLGLEMAQGEYIGFADGDDWLEPDALEHLSGLLDQNPQAGMACGGYYEYFSDPGEPHARPDSSLTVDGLANRKIALQNVMLRYGYFTAIWNKLFRRSVIWKNGNNEQFDCTLGFGEDEKWLISLMRESDFAVFSPRPVYHWRARSGSATHEVQITPRRMSILRAKRFTVDTARDISPELHDLARSRIYNDTFDLQVLAYWWKDISAQKEIRQALYGTWRYWLVSRDVVPLRKAKVIVVRIMMALHMPRAWVRYAFDVKRNQKESQENEI